MKTTTHQITNDWVALWNGDLSMTDRIIAADFISHAAPLTGGAPDDTVGPNALTNWVRAIHTILRNLRFTVQLGPFHDADMVVLRWHATGTYIGGIPNAAALTGTPATFYGTDTLRLDDDQHIAEYWANADSLWFAQQLGISIPVSVRPH